MPDVNIRLRTWMVPDPEPTVWFTSDTHFDHANVIPYSRRPFQNVGEMNEALIERWRFVVKPGHHVYHLGDFAFAKRERIEAILRQLPGQKHLIVGNHDRAYARTAKGWVSVHDYHEITVDGQPLVLFHYGMRVWNRSHYGAIHLFGHSHGTLPGTSQSLDVGVDCWFYAPVSLPEIRARLATLPPYHQEDHHTMETP